MESIVRYARCEQPRRSLTSLIAGKPREIERLTRGLEGGDWKSICKDNSLVAYPTARPVLRGGSGGNASPPLGNPPGERANKKLGRLQTFLSVIPSRRSRRGRLRRICECQKESALETWSSYNTVHCPRQSQCPFGWPWCRWAPSVRPRNEPLKEHAYRGAYYHEKEVTETTCRSGFSYVPCGMIDRRRQDPEEEPNNRAQDRSFPLAASS